MHNQKKDFGFGRRAYIYDDGYEGRFSKRFYNLILDHIVLEPDMKVLDVGCGTGELLKRIAGKEKIRGCGIDIEQSMIEVSKRKCPGMEIQISRSNLMPFENDSFDVLTACMAYHHFDNRNGFAHEAARVLKKGGRLYLADPNIPTIFRKSINRLLKHMNIVGYFSGPKELFANFSKHGFTPITCLKNGYTQLFILEKI